MDNLIKKYWKIVLLATIVIFLLVPFDIIINKGAMVEAQNQYSQLIGNDTSSIQEFADAYLKSAIQYRLYSTLNIAILLIYPVLLSALIFKEYRGEKPKKELFVGQVAFLIVPYIINMLILILIKFIGGITEYLSFGEILKWTGASILLSIFISTIANFVGCFAKTRATHMLSVYGLLFIPIFIIVAIEKLLQSIVFGFSGFSVETINVLAEWPGLKLFSLYAYDYTENVYFGGFGILHILIYLAIIAILSYITYKILDKGKKYNVIPMITIFSVVFILTTVFIGAISLVTNIILATIISLLIIGVIYAIIVLFLKEKNVKKLAISYGVYALVILVLIAIIQGNIFGFETNLPEVNEVEYAVFSTNDPTTTNQNIVYKEKENIQYILDRQSEIIENQTTIKDASKTYYKYYIQYVLKDGKTILRAYDLEPTYEAIYDSSEFINQRYSYILDEEYSSELTEITLLGIYNDSAFEIAVEKENELFDDVINAISKDLIENNSYKSTDNVYGQYGEEEGLQILTIDILTETASGEGYVAYAIIDEKYELVKIVERMIEEENELIMWEE